MIPIKKLMRSSSFYSTVCLNWQYWNAFEDCLTVMKSFWSVCYLACCFLSTILYLKSELRLWRSHCLQLLQWCQQLLQWCQHISRVRPAKFIIWLTQDQEVIVRIAYAKNIASLAEAALKFLEMAQLDYANQENNEDDDSPIQYQVLLLFQRDWLWVNSVFLCWTWRASINNCLLITGLLELCIFVFSKLCAIFFGELCTNLLACKFSFDNFHTILSKAKKKARKVSKDDAIFFSEL